VWGNIHVNEAILRVNIRELRAARADNAAIPRLIETVPRRSYRFLVPVQRTISGSDLKPERLGSLGESQPILVGRNTELLQLSHWLTQALNGSCQIVFIAGEAGIGKSSLINTFLEQAAAGGRAVDWTRPLRRSARLQRALPAFARSACRVVQFTRQRQHG
jgi:AAA ATPase-like protein